MGDNIASSSSFSLPAIASDERAARHLAELLRKQQALTSVREEPRTPPRSPDHRNDDDFEERSRAVCEKAQHEFNKARGNPADGRWIFLTRLLRMGVTSGRNGRWTGARTDIRPVEPLNRDGNYWINAETESEWREWEIRDTEERKVREKVESWKRKLEAQQTVSSVPIPPSAHVSMTSSAALDNPPAPSKASQGKTSTPKTKIATMKTAGSVPKGVKKTPSFSDPLKDRSPFGFAVTKHSTAQRITTGKPKYPAGSQPNPSSQPEHLPTAAPNDVKSHNIADITDVSFLPPSFPSSAIVTSTPNPKQKSSAKSSNARKPDSIPHAAMQSSFEPELVSIPFPSSLQSLPSSHASKTHRHPANVLEASASLPALPHPSIPPRHDIHSSTDKLKPVSPAVNIHHEINTNKKRPAPPSSPQADKEDSHVLKKARTLPLLMGSQTLLPPQVMGPPSPPKATTSAQAVAAVEAQSSSPLTSPPVTPKKQVLPTLRELLASRKGKVRSNYSSPRLVPRGQLGATAPAQRAEKDGPSAPVSDPESAKVEHSKTGAQRVESERAEFARTEQLKQAPKSPPASDSPPRISPRPSIPPHVSPPRSSPPRVSPPPRTSPPLRVSPPRNAPILAPLPVTDPYADDADFDAILAAPPAPKGSQDPYHPLFDPYADDIPLDSPTKSLSSLAGSDSESDDDDDDDDDDDIGGGHRALAAAFNVAGIGRPMSPGFAFHPPVTSTQAGPFLASPQGQRTDSWASVYGPASNSQNAGMAAGGSAVAADVNMGPPPSSAGFPLYSSQFEKDVARQVDAVDALLERDTSVYDAWLREPTPEPQVGMALDDSP